MIINESMMSVFNLNKTGTSYYDDFLNKKDHDYKKLAKGLQGEIKWMSPDKYIALCASKIFHKSVDAALRGMDQKNIDKYAEMMKSGVKFNLPYLNFDNDAQEGRHRALAAKKLGIDKIPVLVVTKWDAKKELGLVGSMKLWYGHTIHWTSKSGHELESHVGMDVDAIKKEVNRIKKSGNYQ